MIDFKKLNDPAEQARIRAEDEKRAQALKAQDARIDAIVDALYDRYESLDDRERSFVSSVRFGWATFKMLSNKQISWLDDLHRKYVAADSLEEAARPARKAFSFSRPR